MNKKVSIFALLLTPIVLSSCFFSSPAPSSAEYNGETYKIEFVDHDKFFPIGIPYNDEEPLFTKNDWNFWHTNEFHFEILYSELDGSQSWAPRLYVSENNFKEAKAYYSDDSNFNFYLGTFGENYQDRGILVEDEDGIKTIKEYMEFYFGKRRLKSIKVNGFNSVWGEITCNKNSKDGLIGTFRKSLKIYNNTIYLVDSYNGGSDAWTLYDLGDTGKALYSMFEKCDFFRE